MDEAMAKAVEFTFVKAVDTNSAVVVFHSGGSCESGGPP
ncbi:hypothetical protein BN903_346 [Halorubrum sp. AJ67]|nr:hypothetical protein BN903_346 [Halorubrum sp. AJ67]